MVSTTLVRLSSPVARSCLVALSATLSLFAILTIHAAAQYPYLVGFHNDYLYIEESRSIVFAYTGIALVAILVSVSSAVACYTKATNYVLIHAGITGVFLPVLILVYFSTSSARYKVKEYEDDFWDMILEYRISKGHKRRRQHQQATSTSITPSATTSIATVTTQATLTSSESYNEKSINNIGGKTMLSSFINLIDSIQTTFSCCGVHSVKDWIHERENYIAPSCCKEHITSINETWAVIFDVDEDFQFKYCTEGGSFHLGCLAALNDDEHGKFAWLSDLIIIMVVITIANTVVSLLLFGLTKTEDNSFEDPQNELSILGASSKQRPSQPTITSIKHRSSVVHTLGGGSVGDNISARAQAVRFNISTSPRTSISGPSKFSAAARRGSSFL